MGTPDVFLYHPSVVHQPCPSHASREVKADGAAADGGSLWERFWADVFRRALALGRWLVALSLAVGAYAGGKLFLDLETEILPVRLVTVDGEVHRLSSQHLQRTVTEHLDRGFLTQDLKRIQRAVDDLPWVRTATLHRVWPDRVALKVEEYRPIARWGSDGLVTADGEVFRPKGETFPTTLPRLSADDAHASLVAANYLKWSDQFGKRGLGLTALDLDARGAWTLHLADGLELDLGASHLEERLDRFMRTWPQIAAAGRPSRIDLRYANGLAVRWTSGAVMGDAEVAQVEPVERRQQASSRSKPKNRG